MDDYSSYVGLDVHKDTIAVAVALPGREEAVYRGEIRHCRSSLRRLIGKLSPHGEVLSFCYEAGPCGYGVYREIIETGHHCVVVAPSLIPRKPGDRVKTDRRDALSLARLHRAGELSAVWVPGAEQEALRDLTRAREDMKAIELKARQRLGAFLLRHGRVYRLGKSRWTQAHFRWLEQQRFDHPAQQVVLQEYVDTVMQAQARVAGLDDVARLAAVAEGAVGDTGGRIARASDGEKDVRQTGAVAHPYLEERLLELDPDNPAERLLELRVAPQVPDQLRKGQERLALVVRLDPRAADGGCCGLAADHRLLSDPGQKCGAVERRGSLAPDPGGSAEEVPRRPTTGPSTLAPTASGRADGLTIAPRNGNPERSTAGFRIKRFSEPVLTNN